MDIMNIAYELYKQKWVNDHVSKEEQLEKEQAYLLDLYWAKKQNTEMDTFDEWIFERGGYRSGLYSVVEEFECEEYEDRAIMKELLGEGLFAIWEREREDFLKDTIYRLLTLSVSYEYVTKICDKIMQDVIDDMKECSDYLVKGYCNDDDIRLAIGRVLLKKMGVSV